MSNLRKIEKQYVKKINKSNKYSTYRAPTYISPILNLVNNHAHSTYKETVGALATDIFPQYIDQAISPSPSDRETYYLSKYKEKYECGFNKFKEKFKAEKEAINKLSDNDLKKYYDDLMFCKTFYGFFVQDAILNHIAQECGVPYKKSNESEETKGIDGFIGCKPYSVKSETYKNSSQQRHININATMVYYRYIYNSKKDKIESVEYYIEEK